MAYQGPTAAIRIVVVDDHELVADAVARVIGNEPDLVVVGIASTVAGALEHVRTSHPDVVVMDVRLPDGSGIDATATIKREHPEVDVVMLTGFADPSVLARALEAGCSGFVAKEGRFTELITTIRSVVNGEVRVPIHLLDGLVAHLRPRAPEIGTDLTIRELEVLRLLASGSSTKSMVDVMSVSVHTIRNHVRNVLAKLHANSRLEAVAVATRIGLLER